VKPVADEVPKCLLRAFSSSGARPAIFGSLYLSISSRSCWAGRQALSLSMSGSSLVVQDWGCSSRGPRRRRTATCPCSRPAPHLSVGWAGPCLSPVMVFGAADRRLCPLVFIPPVPYHAGGPRFRRTLISVVIQTVARADGKRRRMREGKRRQLDVRRDLEPMGEFESGVTAAWLGSSPPC